MKVAILNPVFWPEVRRGSERFAHALATALLARGHDARIVTSHRGRTQRGADDGVPVTRLPRLPHARLDRRLYEHHLTHLPFLVRELRRDPPDVAHALYATDAAAARRAGVPVVFSYMGVPHRQAIANRRLRKELLLDALTAEATTVLSEHAAAGMRRWLGVEAEVVAPPVDTATFTPGGERAQQTTVLCTADRTQERKRVDLLAAAMRHLPEARLVLDSPALDDTAALIAANRAAHVACLPSWGEAFGLVLVEALACGTPAVGPTAEIFDRPGIGEPFTGDDPAELAQALRRAIDSADPVACRARAEDFSGDRCAAAFEAIYARIS